ncbi:unnamed protein product [Prunus armeniaca]
MLDYWLLSQLEALKSSGPDGFPSMFYHKFWNETKETVNQAAMDWFNGSTQLREINKTFIALIPKVATPESMCQFRPISLCNTSYKILSKIIANRLKQIMLEDNIVVAHKAFHYLRLKKKGKKYDDALKVDISKAYDKVEWDFLAATMAKMGLRTLTVLVLRRFSKTRTPLLSGKQVSAPPWELLKSALSFIRERIKKRLEGWKSSFLSLAGKETLIKAVAMAIPAYAMMCFKFPAGLCQEVNNDIAKFWWTNHDKDHGMHWKS